MADERAAVGLARLAGMLRAEAANGLFWGAAGDERERLLRLRRHAAALMAEVELRPLTEIEAIFDADTGLRTPIPATEVRVACADGERVVRRRRLSRTGASLDRRLEDLAESVKAEPPTEVVGIGDTDLAGLPCPHTFLLTYELESPLDSARVRDALEPGDADLHGLIEALAPASAARARSGGPLPVPPEVSEVLGTIAELSAAGRAKTSNFYERERYERILALCADTVEADLAYPRLDCGDLAAECLSTGADAAVFDEDDRLLLIRRTDTGQWAMPGGASEVGETVGAAAVRETFEETGLDVTLRALVWAFDKRDTFDGGDSRMPMIMSFMADAVDPGQELRLAELEASEARWITREEVGDIDFFRGHELRVPAAFAARTRMAS
ncbi:NUDIX hydrolase [Glycomyces tarimensis]